LLDEQEPLLRRSLLTRVQVFRIEAIYLRARSALAIAGGDGSGRLLSVARAGARRIASERMRGPTRSLCSSTPALRTWRETRH
jgi:hypothetical protein